MLRVEVKVWGQDGLMTSRALFLSILDHLRDESFSNPLWKQASICTGQLERTVTKYIYDTPHPKKELHTAKTFSTIIRHQGLLSVGNLKYGYTVTFLDDLGVSLVC